MRRTWVQNRGTSGNSSRHLQHALYKPGTVGLTSSTSSNSLNASIAGNASSFGTSVGGGQFQTIVGGQQQQQPGGENSSIEYGDYYPLLTGRSPEDTLTQTTTQMGFYVQSPFLTDESRTLSKSAAALKDKRMKLREKMLEFTQVAPKKQRVNKPLPQLVVSGHKDQREDWLRQLAGDTSLLELARLPPHGLKGAAFFDEMCTRSIPVVRAVWFMKLIGVQPDQGAMMPSGVGGLGGSTGGAGANVRTTTIAQRNKTWTEEMKRYVEQNLNEFASVWRLATTPSNSLNNNTSTPLNCSSSPTIAFTQSTESFATNFLHNFDSNVGVAVSSHSIGAILTGCGLELQTTNLAVPSSNNTPHQPNNSSSTSSSESRFQRACVKWNYMTQFIEYAYHDGVVGRVNYLTWLVDSIHHSTPFANIPQLTRFLGVTKLASRQLASIALSRAHAHKLFMAYRLVSERAAAVASSSTSSSASGASALIQSSGPTCYQWAQYMMRAIASLLPNTQSWFTSSITANVVSSTTELQGWNTEWLEPLRPDEDEEEEDGEDSPTPPKPPSLMTSTCFTSTNSIPLEDEIDFIADEDTDDDQMTDENSADDDMADLPPLELPTTSYFLSPPSSTSTSSSSATYTAASLLTFAGVHSPTVCRDSWLVFFPRFLTYLTEVSLGLHAQMLPQTNLPLQQQEVASLLPSVQYRCKVVSSIRPDVITTNFPVGLQPSKTALDLFDPTLFIVATATTNPAITFGRFIRQIPEFETIALPLVLTWCIKGAPVYDRSCVSLVTTLLCSYFATATIPPTNTATTTAASRTSPSSPFGSSLMNFLLGFRPGSFLELYRITQLYSMLIRRHLFPYRAFIQHLMTTGTIASPSTTSFKPINLNDWSDLARYYLFHFPIPLDHTTAATSASFSQPTLLPSTAIKNMQQDASVTIDYIELVKLQSTALQTKEHHQLRRYDLIFLDLIWIFEIDLQAIQPQEDTTLNSSSDGTTKPTSVLHGPIELLHQHRKRGSHWTPHDRSIHPSGWSMRCSTDMTNHAQFPSHSLEIHCITPPTSPTTTTSRSKSSPMLQPPTCTAAMLLSTLPLHGVQAVLDHLIITIQNQIELSMDNKVNKYESDINAHDIIACLYDAASHPAGLLICCPPRLSTLLASSTFLFVLTEICSLLELFELHLSLHLLIQHLLDLLSLSPTNPSLEQVTFSVLRRNYQTGVMLGFESAIKSKLIELLRLQPNLALAELYLDTLCFPPSITRYLRTTVLDRWIQTNTNTNTNVSISLTPTQQQQLKEMTWEKHLRQWFEVTSTTRSSTTSTIPLAHIATLVPLNHMGFSSLYRELFRSVIQSTIRVWTLPPSELPGSNRSPLEQRRIRWLHAQWWSSIQIMIFVLKRNSQVHLSGQRINMMETFMVHFFKLTTRLITDINNSVIRNDPTITTLPNGLTSVLADLDLSTTLLTGVAVPAGSESFASIWSTFSGPSSPLLPDGLLSGHLLSSLTLFFITLISSDIGSHWRVGKILTRISSQMSPVTSASTQMSLAQLSLLVAGIRTESNRPFWSYLFPRHRLNLDCMVTCETVTDMIPMIRLVAQADRTPSSTTNSLFFSLLTSPLMRTICLQHQRSFFKEIIPLIPLSILRPVMIDFIQLQTPELGLQNIFKSDSNSLSTSLTTQQALISSAAPWNVRTIALMVQLFLLDTKNDPSSDSSGSLPKLDGVQFILQAIKPCLSISNTVPSTTISPHAYGTRQELVRCLLPFVSLDMSGKMWSELSNQLDHQLEEFIGNTRVHQPASTDDEIIDEALMKTDSNRNGRMMCTVNCSCCDESFIIASMIQCDPRLFSLHSPPTPFTLHLMDQCSLIGQRVTPNETSVEGMWLIHCAHFSYFLVHVSLVLTVFQSPMHLWPSSLCLQFQHLLTLRLACLVPCYSQIYTATPTEYERLLKVILLTLMLIYDTPTDMHTKHSSPVGSRFFTVLLNFFQRMMDVVSASVDSELALKVSSSGLNSPTTNKDRSSGDHLLFDLQGLFYVASRSLRISQERRQLIAQSFDSGHGAVEEDVQWPTPVIPVTNPVPSTNAVFTSTYTSSSAAAAAALQDPWLLLEGLSSSPFIDAMYEQSKTNIR